MFWFTASDGTKLFLGKDKFENEELIRHGWPEDVWFHVDGLSSAHVYARINPRSVDGDAGGNGGGGGAARAVTLDDVSDDAIRDCGQLVKANSIEGCKKASVTVIYTLWSNLKKDGSMATGAVSFHDDRAVRRFNVGERDREALARLAKTREENQPDLRAVSCPAPRRPAHARAPRNPHPQPQPHPPPAGAGAARRKRARRQKGVPANAVRGRAQPRRGAAA
jgi:hypothetical protein